MPAGSFSGNDGWESTGASIDGSSIMVSAKFPVKHIPMAPTPGPPRSPCAKRASDRRHFVTGLDSFAARARKRRDMGADAGHLRHHDDGRPCTGHVDDLGDAIERNVAACEILERI